MDGWIDSPLFDKFFETKSYDLFANHHLPLMTLKILSFNSRTSFYKGKFFFLLTSLKRGDDFNSLLFLMGPFVSIWDDFLVGFVLNHSISSFFFYGFVNYFILSYIYIYDTRFLSLLFVF